MMINDRSSPRWDWDGPAFTSDIRGVLSSHIRGPSTANAATLLQCEDCEEVSPAGAWCRGYVGCETCNDHSAIMCPWCGWGHDGISTTPKVVTEPSPTAERENDE
jgi:hypothetical protein